MDTLHRLGHKTPTPWRPFRRLPLVLVCALSLCLWIVSVEKATRRVVGASWLLCSLPHQNLLLARTDLSWGNQVLGWALVLVNAYQGVGWFFNLPWFVLPTLALQTVGAVALGMQYGWAAGANFFWMYASTLAVAFVPVADNIGHFVSFRMPPVFQWGVLLLPWHFGYRCYHTLPSSPTASTYRLAVRDARTALLVVVLVVGLAAWSTSVDVGVDVHARHNETVKSVQAVGDRTQRTFLSHKSEHNKTQASLLALTALVEDEGTADRRKDAGCGGDKNANKTIYNETQALAAANRICNSTASSPSVASTLSARATAAPSVAPMDQVAGAK